MDDSGDQTSDSLSDCPESVPLLAVDTVSIAEISESVSRQSPSHLLQENGMDSTNPDNVSGNDRNITDEVQSMLMSIPPEILRGKFSTVPGERPKPGLDRSLPPIYKIDKIFDDLATKARQNGFNKFLEHIGSRELRVATMCSGTESPLLALEMIQDSFSRLFGKTFRLHHLFSAEIEPFKQSYIQRNFAPNIIFRDVNELVADEATTAFGSLKTVPTNPDLLVVGFSCVDFSALNFHRKALEEMGESGHTFYSVLRYMQRCRPALVVLENVCGAPWEQIKSILHEISYTGYHVKVDSKNYYLPQTRERGYMLAIDQTKLVTEDIGNSDSKSSPFARMMKTLERPASSPATQFLLKHDDPRLRDAVNDISSVTSKDRQPVDWTRYKARHLGYRMREGYGDKRPLTRWQDNGTCQMPDFYWHGWSRTQTERVWDTLDVNFLRGMIRGYDINFKSRIIDLSQGLDRELDHRASGVAGCLTPRGQHFITSRGGPLLGIEALALQGIPIDRLLIGNDSQKALHDLAGNAMSSTVVGAAIVSALILGHQALDRGPVSPGVSEKVLPTGPPVSATQKNCMRLLPLDSPGDRIISTAEICRLAAQSSRLCYCEGQIGMRTENISKCSKCGHTACSKCGRNPTHLYEPIGPQDLQKRLSPVEFQAFLKLNLPTRLYVNGIDPADFDQLRGPQSAESEDVRHAWDAYLQIVQLIVGEELKFHHVTRQRWWTITYQGPNSLLTLNCSSNGLQWALYGVPGKDEPSNSPLRQILSYPIAKMVPTDEDFLTGTWLIGSPISSHVDLTISSKGSRVDSFPAKCGLQRPKFRNSKVWSILSITGSDEHIGKLELDIRGDYELLPNCGRAVGSLHKRPTPKGPPIYLFLDPTEIGPSQFDSWVFALEHERLDIGQVRDTIAEIRPNWSPFYMSQHPEIVRCWYRNWKTVPNISLGVPDHESSAIYQIIETSTINEICSFNCDDSYATVLHCSVPATSLGSNGPASVWKRADLLDSPGMLVEFAWLLHRSIGITHYQNWNSIQISTNGFNTICSTCAPPKPRLSWALDDKDRVFPYENPKDAAAYERSIKHRPSPFLGFTCVDRNSVLQLRICLNVLALLHRALGNLIDPKEASLQWRLCIDTTGYGIQKLPKLTEKNNKLDAPHSQPPGFLSYSLRSEQLRSLRWMCEQENDKAPPFEEQEVVEALLPNINWRAEAKASVQRIVRGGILGDEVGYGKTAVSLGLIDVQLEKDRESVPQTGNGAIPVKATLILIPHHLFDQWKREIKKFLGNKYKILAIKTNSVRNAPSIREFEDADIVLASTSLLRGTAYYSMMEWFAAAPEVPKGEGRIFNEWLQDAMTSLAEQVDTLVEFGPSEVLEKIDSKKKKLRDGEKLRKYKPSKRLKGQRFQEYLLKMKNLTSNVSETPVSNRTETSLLISEVSHQGKRKRSDSDAHDDGAIGNGLKPQAPELNKKKARPQASPTGVDPAKVFGLSEVGMNWKNVKSPILHMFEFNRLIIDEFTYSKDRNYSAALAIPARRKWILSGTPPLNDFADVKSFSPLLGINLGIDEDDGRRVENERLKTLQREQTEVEQFQPFVTRRTAAWHLRRHEIAQGFLDQFMRKNTPDIDEISWSEHIIGVVLSACERAEYLELFMQLMSQNLRLRRNGRGLYDSDEVARLDEIIGNSNSPEEALSKRCSLFASPAAASGVGEVMPAGEKEQGTMIISQRRKQLLNLGSDIESKLKRGLWLRSKLSEAVMHFDRLLDAIDQHQFGDVLVTTMIQSLLKQVMTMRRSTDGKEFYLTAQEKKDNPDDTRAEYPQTDTELLSDLNYCTDSLRRLIYETIAHARALRLYQAVRCFQKMEPDTVYVCYVCATTNLNPREYSILGECGHSVCKACLGRCIAAEGCLMPNCGGTVQSYRVVGWDDIGRLDSGVVDDTYLKYGGSKFAAVINLLLDTTKIPKDDQVLLFIQFAELMDAASRALKFADIPHITIQPGDRTPGSKISAFQRGAETIKSKVLILNLGDVTASGLNLQNANHIVFLGPLVSRSQYDYNSGMAQAIGRSRRYGQTKHVHIYHILALKTVEVNIFELRRRQCLVRRDGVFHAVNKSEVLDTDGIDWRGFPLEGSNADGYDNADES
ncbi:hypothetical protein FQN57_002693 [Myotisia sp. PD_48]|nr:hypothetical protein FQN57_002693 [Myotisia sp. PD_48]